MVMKSGGKWKKVDNLWLSNGKRDDKAILEYRVSFEPPAKPKAKAKTKAPKSKQNTRRASTRAAGSK